MNETILSWEIFKNMVDQRDLTVQWIDQNNRYKLYIMDGFFICVCYLDKDDSANTIDFEQNYKNDGTATLGVTLDGPVTTLQHGYFHPPSETDTITISYPDNVTEVYQYRHGGTNGSILMSITLVYTNASKNNLLSAART